MADDPITDVKMRKLDGTGKILAFVDITLLGKYVVRGFKVMQGDKGPWVSMPSRRDKDGAYQDTFFPLFPQARQELTNRILEKFRTLGTGQVRQSEEPEDDT